MDVRARDNQLDVIRRRYADEEYNVIHTLPRDLRERRLARIASPADFENKRILEIGAGGSTYLELFLAYGCKELVANDLVPRRLELVQISDPRYSTIAGDLLELDFGDRGFDIIFANLTLMFLVPMLDDVFARIREILVPGGLLLTVDPNYLCPISIYRKLTDRSGANPANFFNPFSFRAAAVKAGLQVAKTTVFSGDAHWADGNWLLGTSFAMRAQRPLVSNHNLRRAPAVA